MPGWGKPLYEMKQAEIPKGEIPTAFDWRDKGVCVCPYVVLCGIYLLTILLLYVSPTDSVCLSDCMYH